MPNIKETKDGLVEKSTGRKIVSPLDSCERSLRKTPDPFERAVLNALEYLMSEMSTIGRLIASQHPDERIREAVKPLLYSTLGITDRLHEISPASPMPLLQERRAADEN